MRNAFCAGLLLLLVAGTSAAGESGNVNASLKQVTRATKGLEGLVAQVEYKETVRTRSTGGRGTMYVSFDGWIRAEIGEGPARVVLLTPPYLYEHRPDDRTVEVYDITANPHRLAGYVLLGFVPAGTAMKKRYEVVQVEKATLGGKPVHGFLLTPKSEEAARAIARIQLWVDPDTGLPLRQKIVHATGETDLDIRYLDVSVRSDLDVSLFTPRWPEGTVVRRRD